MKQPLYGFLLFFTVLTLASCIKTESKTDLNKKGYFQVKRSTLLGQLKWNGIVRSANRIEIRADRKVKVSNVLVKNFDTVKKGDLLIDIDKSELTTKLAEQNHRSRSLELEMHSSKVKSNFSERILERKKTLYAKGIIPEQEYDEAKREFKVGENDTKAKELELKKIKRETQELEEQMKNSSFRAPLSGIVSDMLSLESSSQPEVQAGQLLGIVSDPSNLALWINVEEGDIPKLKLGASLKVKLDSFREESFDGKVIDIHLSSAQNGDPAYSVPQGGTKAQTFEVGIGLDTKQKIVQEGYNGQAVFTFATKENVVTVPAVAEQ